MTRKLFLTPSALPTESETRQLEIPSSPEWLGIFNAALLTLAQSFNYEQVNDTDMTPDDVAALCYQIYENYLLPVAPLEVTAPVWEDVNGDDASSQLPVDAQGWYGYMEGANFVDTLAGWVFLGQVAAVYGADGAIQFATTLHNLRLFFRTLDIGAIIQVFVDDVLYEEIDTYSAEPGLAHVDLLNIDSNVRIVHTGTANPLASTNEDGNYAMEFVRKHIYEAEVQSPLMLRQSTTNTCLLEQSLDNGETWTPAFDYSKCIPPVQQSILDILNQQQQQGWTGDSPTQINPHAPSTTWVFTTGEPALTSEQRVAALCQACSDAVAAACAAYVEAVNGTLTVPSIVAVALGLAATILTIVASAVWLPLGLAIAAAALEIYNSYVTSVSTAFASDPDNQAKVSCLMYQTLIAAPVTQATFQASVGANQPCWTTDENNLRAMVNAMFNSTTQGANLYHAFINSLGGTMQAIQAGATPSTCPCDNVTWCHRFTPANKPAGLQVNGGGVSGSVWRSTLPPSGNSYLQLVLSFYAPDASHVTEVTVLGNKDTSAGSNIYHVNLNASVQECTFGCLGYPLGAAGDVHGQVAQCVGAIYTNAPTTELYFEWIQVSGTGLDPFGGCSNC